MSSAIVKNMRFSPMYLLVILALLAACEVSALCVTGTKANLRGGPGSKYAVSWVVQKHMPLAEVDRRGSWVQVKDVDGVTHWVYRGLVSTTAQCLVVKTKIANLRQGPGKNFPLAKLKSAGRYFAFKKLDSENGWYKIDTGGLGIAWIHENLVWRAFRVQKIGF
jgi:SH3-like domain-containing protein